MVGMVNEYIRELVKFLFNKYFMLFKYHSVWVLMECDVWVMMME